jgi:hypothetical protein
VKIEMGPKFVLSDGQEVRAVKEFKIIPDLFWNFHMVRGPLAGCGKTMSFPHGTI